MSGGYAGGAAPQVNGGPAKKIKLTYFNIEGAAEKVRLAFVLGKINFEDDRIAFDAWQGLKPKSKFGQLPLMTVDGGEQIAQSPAMLRYAGVLGGLYSTSDVMAMLKMEEVIGLEEDIGKAIMPSMYVGMRPALYAHDDKTPEARTEIQLKLRGKLMEGPLPTMLGHLQNFLAEDGTLYVRRESYHRRLPSGPEASAPHLGILDGIPKDILDGFPRLKAYLQRFQELPEVAAHYAEREAAKEAAKKAAEEKNAYKLTYFDARGVVEINRFMFAMAKKDYEDKRFGFSFDVPGNFSTIKRPEFDAAKAAGQLDASCGKLPLLQVEGVHIGQSKAIERFVAGRLGFLGKSDLAAAQIDSVCETVRDVKDAYQKVRATQGDDEKKAAMEKWFGEDLPERLAQLDKSLPSGPGPYTFGDQPSLADIHLYQLLFAPKGFFDNVDGTRKAFSECAKLKRVVGAVDGLETVQAWISKRPDTMM